jgi:glycosyltransferase involved in cell wall biosynthesis
MSSLRIYWYWPHPHRRVSPLCLAVLRPGDALTVHALASLGGETFDDDITEYEVVRDLPDPTAIPKLRRPVELPLRRSRTRSRLVRRGFDVAHIGNLVYQTDWTDLRRLRRHVALVSDVHDVRPHRRALPAAAETALLRATYRTAGHLIVLHDVLKDELLADFPVDPARVHVVPHVLDADATPDPDVAEPARPVFLLFGTLRTNKGLDVLADALLALGPDFDGDVVVAGSGDADVARRWRERVGHLPYVTLEHGRVDDRRKRELFSVASWALLPYTEFHSQSGVLADAYAYRVPLIVSDVGAIGPTVRGDGTGYVVPPGDADALAAAMLDAARAGAAPFAPSLDAAAHRHDVSVVGPTLRAIYEVAANER